MSDFRIEKMAFSGVCNAKLNIKRFDLAIAISKDPKLEVPNRNLKIFKIAIATLDE